MRASYEDIDSKKGNASFLAYHLNVPAFIFKWHYHPEYELTLITKGHGKRLVGDSYENFTAGDLVLIGPGMPHTWVSNKERGKTSSAVVIQFSEKFIQSFLQHQEFGSIAPMLTGSSHGFFFSCKASKKIAEEIDRLPNLPGAEKIMSLIMVLQRLSQLRPAKLSSPHFTTVKGMENEIRVNKICQYIQKYFREQISLSKMAAMLHLSDAAFCKFFKRATGKTFSDYLNDIRIGNACSLLTDSDKPISTIAYESGFESLTYFNRVFSKKKQTTPRNYRNNFLYYQNN